MRLAPFAFALSTVITTKSDSEFVSPFSYDKKEAHYSLRLQFYWLLQPKGEVNKLRVKSNDGLLHETELRERTPNNLLSPQNCGIINV